MKEGKSMKQGAKPRHRSFEPRVVFYDDELNDEFAEDDIQAKKIDGSYRYLRERFFEKVLYVFWYRIVAIPVAFVYLKLHFHHKVVNRRVLVQARKQGALRDGFFLYGNHTQQVADALIPTFVCMPRRALVVVHANNVSMPVLGRVNPYLGALPLPDDAPATKHFLRAMDYKRKQGCGIVIYPEAHIWPFYTDIRPFSDASFRYPAGLSVPVFCFTNTYQKRRFSRKPRLVTYVDGPFYGDASVSKQERKLLLREEIYHVMKERALKSSVIVVEYRKRGENDD